MIGRRLLLAAVAAAGVTAALGLGAGAARRVHGPAAAAALATVAQAETAPAQRRALFGELHLHTGYSFDAYALMGARTTPEDAYRFAKGEPIRYLGQVVQRPRPLDFTAVTDHAEYIGTFNQMEDANSEAARSEIGQQYRAHPIQVYFKFLRNLRGLLDTPGLNARAAMA
jgi:hypothetical protein